MVRKNKRGECIMKKYVKLLLLMLFVSLLTVGAKIQLDAAETEDSYGVSLYVERPSHDIIPNSQYNVSTTIYQEIYDEENEEYDRVSINTSEISNLEITPVGDSAKYASVDDGILTIENIPKEVFAKDDLGIDYYTLTFTVSADVKGETIYFSEQQEVRVQYRDFDFYLDENHQNWAMVMTKGEVVTLHPELIIYDGEHPDGAKVEDAHFYISGWNGNHYENETVQYSSALKVRITDDELVIGAKRAGDITLDGVSVYLLKENGEKDSLIEIWSERNSIFNICIRPESTPALTADSTGTVNVPEDMEIFTFTPEETGKYHFTFEAKMDEYGDYYINNDCYDAQGNWVGESSDDDDNPSPYTTYSLEKGVIYTFFYNYTGDQEPLEDIDLNTGAVTPGTGTTGEEGNKTPTAPVVSGDSTGLNSSSTSIVSNSNADLPAVNTVLTDTATKNTYVVTAKGSTVAYKGTKNKKAKKIMIPSTVTIDGTTYKVTSIASGAFKNNKKLTKVKVGSNVQSIGKKAFYGCKKLKTIVIKSKKLTAKSVGAKAFTKAGSSNYKKCTVKVPRNKKSAYTKVLKKKGLNAWVKIK